MPPLHGLTLAWENLNETLNRLNKQPVTEAWVIEWGEALTSFRDLYVSAYWDFSRNTKEVEANQRLDYITQELNPKFKVLNQELTRRVTSWQPSQEPFARIVESQNRKLQFGVPETIGIYKQLDALIQKYEAALSETVVDIDGGMTSEEARHLLHQERDRTRRQVIWEHSQHAKLKNALAINAWFTEMVALRQKVATICGFDNFVAYSWAKKERTYPPASALELIGTVRDVFSPVIKQANVRKAQDLKVPHLRPWDDVEIVDNGVSDPFTAHDYSRILVTAYDQIDPTLGQAVKDMIASGRADLMTRSYKVPGAYSTVQGEGNKGLVFTNGVGDVASLRVMLHETAHALHQEASGRNTLYFERFASFEIMEFVAYSLQFLTIEVLGTTGVLTPPEQRYLKTYAGRTLLDVFAMYDTIERFQHWLFSRNGLTKVEDMDLAWLDMQQPLGVDWSGYEEIRKKGWQFPHIILDPFYSIEYIIAYIGMLAFIRRWRDDPARSVSSLLELLKYGSSISVEESFAMVEIKFPFSHVEIVAARATFENEFLQKQ